MKEIFFFFAVSPFFFSLLLYPLILWLHRSHQNPVTFCWRLFSKLAVLVCSFLSAAFITAISDSLDFRTRVISILALQQIERNKQLIRNYNNRQTYDETLDFI